MKRWATERPESPAVIETASRSTVTITTYRQLWERAQTFAAPIAPGERVGLALPKGADWIAAVLGVWSAGAAFVPLDVELPRARLQQMITDAGVTRVIDHPPTSILPPLGGEGSSGDLAYVLFTSGSTGRPKGVEVTHAGIDNVLAQQVEAFGVTGASRVLWLLSPAFDASLSDIGVALRAGAAIVIPPAGAPVLDVVAAHQVTHADLPPSLLPHIDPARAPACLETVIIGGEVADRAAVRRWAAAVRLIGAYGPTEATICTSLVRCTPDWDRPRIGRPLDGVEYTVTDSGELAIAGAGLARGYANQPELTAARFVSIGGARHFLTGDRVRPLDGGDFEYLGRLDRQLKLAGRLIAPEEIEAALREAGGGEAAVVSRRAGVRQILCAYTTGRADPEVLRRRLPPWMIPRFIERLDALPRTASGKIDLSALAARPLPATTGAAPLDDRQSAVAALIAAIIGVAPSSPDDDFFELGGDSLAAVALVAAAAARGLELSSEGPWTVAALADSSRPAPAIATADLARDAAWDPADLERLAAARSRPLPGPPRSLLITGATGKLGRRVIGALRARLPGAEIISLVRGDSAGLRGDLARPRLGLDDATYRTLAETLDGIVHLGARLDVLRPYAELRGVNLEGTREVIRLAAAGRPKALVFASTLSVFAATGDRGLCLESDDLLAADRRIHGGYAQSKVAAELAVRAASLPATSIVRLGLLTGDPGERDWLRLFVVGARELGALPAMTEPIAVDITPVDHAAEVIAALAVRPSEGVATYHVANQRGATLDELAAAIVRAGVPLERPGPETWRALLRDRRPSPETAALLLGLCRAGDAVRDAKIDHRFDLFAATGLRFDDRQARRLGLGRPDLTEALLDRTVAEILEREANR